MNRTRQLQSKPFWRVHEATTVFGKILQLRTLHSRSCAKLRTQCLQHKLKRHRLKRFLVVPCSENRLITPFLWLMSGCLAYPHATQHENANFFWSLFLITTRLCVEWICWQWETTIVCSKWHQRYVNCLNLHSKRRSFLPSQGTSRCDESPRQILHMFLTAHLSPNYSAKAGSPLKPNISLLDIDSSLSVIPSTTEFLFVERAGVEYWIASTFLQPWKFLCFHGSAEALLLGQKYFSRNLAHSGQRYHPQLLKRWEAMQRPLSVLCL